MKNFTNTAKLAGYVHSFDLKEAVSKNNPTNVYITGDLSVATDENATEIVKVRVFVMEKTRAGAMNQTFQTLKQLMATGKTYEQYGLEATKVRIDGSIDVNEFYGRDGNLVQSMRVQERFVHINSRPNDRCQPLECVIDTVITSAKAFDNEDGSEYMRLEGYTFDYRGRVLPVKLYLHDARAISAFQEMNPSEANPILKTLRVTQKTNTVVVENTEDQNDDGSWIFGAPTVAPTTREFKEFRVIGAGNESGNFGDDGVITMNEFRAAVSDHDTALAARRGGQAQNSNGFGNSNNRPVYNAPRTNSYNASPTSDEDFVF